MHFLFCAALLINLSLFLCKTAAVGESRGELVKSWIGVPNQGRGDIVIIDSNTETFQSINIETSHPSYIDASTKRNEFYVRDHETVYIYDSITLERLYVIKTGCSGQFYVINYNTQWYSEYMYQLWNVCDANNTLIVIDVQTRQIIARIPVDYHPHAVVARKDYAFVTGVYSIGKNNSVIITKYSTKSFDKIDTAIIGDIIWNGNSGTNDPHLFVDSLETNADYNHYVYSTIEYQNKLYKIDTNNLKTVQTLTLDGAHGIYGSKNNFYIGNFPSSDTGVIYLINSYNMTEMETFDNFVIAFVHNLMLNCEENKLFVAHSNNNAVSVFDITDNGELIRHRIIYKDGGSRPMSLNRICVYENILTSSSIDGKNVNIDVVINLIGSVIGYGYLGCIVIVMILITVVMVYILYHHSKDEMI